jgi:imidazolonepropionase-like amidohydrolase
LKAIINGKIITMEKEDFDSGIILINDEGKIEKIGAKIEIPEGCEIIDAQGRYVLPGFIDAHTHLGIYEEIYSHEGDDVNEMSEPVTPQLRAIDGINIHDIGFQDALKGGVTTAMIAPGSANVVGGTVCIMKTAGKSFNSRLIKESAGMKVAFGENPKEVYGSEKKMPYTRMGIAALLRETLVDGQNYINDKESEKDLGKDEIARVLNHKMP